MGNTVSTRTDYSQNRDPADGYTYMAEYDRENKIGEGKVHMAYVGHYVDSSPPGGPKVGKPCVVKLFKESVAWYYNDWFPHLTTHKRAAQFADRFNDIRKSDSRTINVLFPLISKIDRRGGFYLFWIWNFTPVAKFEYVSLEPFLTGNYQRFNNNLGWTNKSEPAPLMQAFSHWTYHISESKYLVCDLQ